MDYSGQSFDAENPILRVQDESITDDWSLLGGSYACFASEKVLGTYWQADF